jgi:hypothetical protein
MPGATVTVTAEFEVIPTASITFTPADESGQLEVTAPEALTLSKTGQTKTLALTVSGDGFTGVTWIVDGLSIGSSANGITLENGGKTLTIDAANQAVSLGGHSVTVFAVDTKGVPWSSASIISFTVEK